MLPLRSLATAFVLGFAAAVVTAGAPSCSTAVDTPDPPRVVFLRVETTNVTAGMTIGAEVEVVAGPGRLTYLWEATAGSFARTDVEATSWTAPAENGLVTLTVTVSGAGGSSSLSTDIVVGPAGDADADGYAVVQGDCNDADPTIHPGAAEGSDGVDNDCDGIVDEGSDDIDDDGDGFTDLQGDCDDEDSAAFPGSTEVIDGVDQDCDGVADDHTTAYDDDGDQFSEDQGDCSDNNATVSPAASELLDGFDNDCDGVTDENTVGSDDDGDGFTELEGDCDDGDTESWPGATELPDSNDNDCNGIIDDGSIISDDDGDGSTDLYGDCDDNNPYTYPGAAEYLDGTDNDCDGLVDEGMHGADNDGDGYSEAQGDCNDLNASISPGAIELDDDIDNDCDGLGYTNPPTAVATREGTLQACLPVQVSARQSYDPDGDTLTFQWVFTTRPAISVLTDEDISNRFQMNASFIPDSAGYWSLGLIVSDGVFTSTMATVGFTVPARPGNSPPEVSFVGGDISGIGNTTCQTDAYGACTGCTSCSPPNAGTIFAQAYVISAQPTVDPDGDPVWFTWSAEKLTGDGGPPEIAVLPAGNAAEVTFDMSVTCAASSTGQYEVEAEVHDCNGATATGSIYIVYTCQS